MRTEIVLHTVATGAEDVIHAIDALIEAPNWSPCGTFLIVNGDGRIYRLNLDAPETLHQIPTGPLDRLNNDHGISPDGTTLAVSQSPARGTSTIWTLPVAGSATPTRITPNAPSYFHGWSPDGATFTYTARRDGRFNVFTCPADGSGPEVPVTHTSGHCDGPDYTPDGQWIWFNSDHHGGLPELWRVHPDGSALQRMTDDDRVNWFPHPSPDGAHILYLAYGPHVEGHPRDEEVELRLLPPEGGAPRTIAAFHGGQGSINVPNWSPDGKRFAYARYARP